MSTFNDYLSIFNQIRKKKGKEIEEELRTLELSLIKGLIDRKQNEEFIY